MAESQNAALEKLSEREYQYGFVTDIESESVPPGLNEGIVRLISSKKNEPEWLLAWRLKALARFFEMAAQESEPTWAMVRSAGADSAARRRLNSPANFSM